MDDFRGKLVLITGGVRGTGKAIAHAFAERGADLVLNYFHATEEADTTRAELAALGGRVQLVRASVAAPEQVYAMFEQIRAEHGRLDVLVNNAAAGAFRPVGELTERDLDRAWSTNLKGSLWCAQHAASLMRERGGGAIVNCSSIGVDLVPDTSYLSVGVTKAAVEALTRYLAVEYAPHRIRVNTASASLLDGRVMTRFPDAERFAQRIRAGTPLDRLPTEDEYAAVVLFLASDAASWITGQTVLADGGIGLGSRLPTPAQAVAPVPAPATALEAVDRERRIAVVGMGLVAPGADNVEQFWSRLNGGEPAFSEPGARFDLESFYDLDLAVEDRTHVRVAGFVHDAPDDPDGEADYATRWLRQALREALAGCTVRGRDRCAFLVGHSPSGSQHLEETMVALGLEHRMSTTDSRVRAHLRLAGLRPERYLSHVIAAEACAGLLPDGTETLTVDTACASGLYAAELGVRGLVDGRYDVAVCGGTHVFSPREMVLFDAARTMSRSGALRAFDARADGTLFADGAAVVVLKSLDRAEADGDRVYGILLGFGATSDGRGKAIYAPNPDGQLRCLERTFAASGVEPADVGLVVAHSTGTPLGDANELDVLAQVYAAAGGCAVVSNKSLVGHTAYAAGTISLIHALLAMAHERIPAQAEYASPPAHDPLAGGPLAVPTADVAWPSSDRPRVAAISAFGFGGTNMHVHVADRPTRDRPASASSTEDIVLVAWSTDLPGDPEPEDLASWLVGSGPPPAAGFGDHPPLLSPAQPRIPPPVLRVIDRTQVMALRAVDRLRGELGDRWERLRADTGVFVAHAGPTRASILYGLRLRLPDLERHVFPAPDPAFVRFSDEIRTLIPPASEASIAGILSNIISGRVANHYDIHGPNITVDNGDAGTFAAVHTATSYLRTGDVDLALVIGINGNATPEMRAVAGVDLAEGAFAFALTRRGVAEREDLPILSIMDGEPYGEEVAMSALIVSGRSYLAADSAIAVLSAVLSGRTGVITRTDPWTKQVSRIAVRPTGPAVTELRVDPVADPYLAEHVFAGRPTVPGACLIAHAAAAAARLVPGMHAVAFESVRFVRFVRTRPGEPAAFRVHAQHAGGTDTHPRVRVRITGDVRAPGGAMLDTDRTYAEMDVLLAAHPPAAPVHSVEPLRDGVPAVVPNDPDNLGPWLHGGGRFLADPVVATEGASARLHRTAAFDAAPFRGFAIPGLLLDAIVQLVMLRTPDSDPLPLQAPTAIARINLYRIGNDADLPVDVTLVRTPVTGDGKRFDVASAAALGPDGRVIAELSGLVAIAVGTVPALVTAAV